MIKKAFEIGLILLLIVLSWIFFLQEVSPFPIIVFVLSFIILILAIPIKETKKEIVEEEPVKEKEEKKVSSEEPTINFPANFNEKKFLDEAFNLYKNVQEDFMNFKYDNLMMKLGIDMYDQFSKQMKKLETRNKQSVRTNIELDKIETISFNQYDGYNEAVINIVVLEDKYMKNKKEDFRITSAGVRYESGYSLTLINRDKKKTVKKCSNCNEKISTNPTKCPKCKTMIVEATNTWIITELKLLGSQSKKG